jgi:hypothetical protein
MSSLHSQIVQTHSLQAGVEGLNDARPDFAASAIGTMHDAKVGQAVGVLSENRRRFVGSVIHDHP